GGAIPAVDLKRVGPLAGHEDEEGVVSAVAVEGDGLAAGDVVDGELVVGRAGVDDDDLAVGGREEMTGADAADQGGRAAGDEGEEPGVGDGGEVIVDAQRVDAAAAAELKVTLHGRRVAAVARDGKDGVVAAAGGDRARRR